MKKSDYFTRQTNNQNQIKHDNVKITRKGGAFYNVGIASVLYVNALPLVICNYVLNFVIYDRIFLSTISNYYFFKFMLAVKVTSAFTFDSLMLY
jgi:hypothetical protein